MDLWEQSERKKKKNGGKKYTGNTAITHTNGGHFEKILNFFKQY